MQADSFSGSESDVLELPSELAKVSALLDQKPESLASGDKEIEEAALAAAKYIFDLTLQSEQSSCEHIKELLDTLNYTEAPRTRSQTAAQSQSQGAASSSKALPSHAITQPTPLESLLINGMEEEQIWAQLELKASNVCTTLEEYFDARPVDARGAFLESDDDNLPQENGASDEDSDEDEIDGLNGFDWAHNEEDGSEEEEDEEDESEEEEEEVEDEEASGSDLGEGVEALRDPSSDESEMDLDALPLNRVSRGRQRIRHTELDDDFFSLAEFNAETEQAESKNVSRGALGDDSDDEEEEEGIDIFAPVDDSEDVELGTEGEAYYNDFFTPPLKMANSRKRKAVDSAQMPPRKSQVRFNEQVKVKSIKAKGKSRALNDIDDEDDSDDEDLDWDATKDDALVAGLEEENAEDDLEDSSVESGRDAVSRLKDDLFAEDDEDENDGDLSNHEKRMRVLREQIRELEQENVGEKDWVLRGEVNSKARPQNSLLEEDLDFERITKPVPVITDEVVQDLESRIKARIVEGHFDDVVRKRAVDEKPFLPSKIFELQDTKSKESLSQIYEKEYMAEQNGSTLDDRDGRLMKEHKELEQMWENICYKLDALCNAHFTPKQPTATISTISNVSAVSLESALPSAQASHTVLAPEEVFSANASDLVSKLELTPAQKQALRTKERKKRKKQRDAIERSVDKFAKVKRAKGTRQQKDAALKSLVKNGKGVTVIGKESKDRAK